ncbi:MAG: NAD(P)H-dependent oxidoreductase subunit E [Candidatus Sumerlaeaceae bacterium]|jgi:NADH-quinone oxidoreductase subunit E
MAPCACEVERQSNAARFQQLCEILDRFERNPNLLVPILQQVQQVYRYLPPEALEYVATALGLPSAHVYGVATFYAHFTLEPKGKHQIRVCDGTACHVKGSTAILEALRERLKLEGSSTTTDDMQFSLETVSCLGACGLAPVVVIDDGVHGNLTPSQAVELVDKIAQQEEDAQ